MHLETTQKQNLAIKLTLEMQHSLQMLQMSAMELQMCIVEKAAENPLLNIEYPDQNIEKMALVNVPSGYDGSSYAQKEASVYTKPLQQEIQNIKEHLMDQVPANKYLSRVEEKILLFYIGNLNEAGYLEISVEEASAKFGVSIEVAGNVLQLLQSLEPAGIGARNLKECLLIQTGKQLSQSSLPYKIIEHHLEDLAEGAFKKIAVNCGVSVNEVQEAVNFIKGHQPKPLQSTVPEAVEYIIPDIIFEKVATEWIPIINRYHLPSLSINKHYMKMMKVRDAKTKAYLKENLKDASILIQGLEQRDKTLYRLGKLLSEEQSSFFEKGFSALKPMRLKDAAALLDVHESTISRAAKSKYIQTPFGTFQLQTLFAKGFLNGEGKMESTPYIKTRIKEIIKIENHGKPFSDQVIAAMLRQENIRISRRTVAKYREALMIDCSIKRKQSS